MKTHASGTIDNFEDAIASVNCSNDMERPVYCKFIYVDAKASAA